MVPNAAPKVVAINKLDPMATVDEPPWEAAPDLVDTYSPLTHLLATPAPGEAGRQNWPPSDPFTLYLMATLCRYSYADATNPTPELEQVQRWLRYAMRESFDRPLTRRVNAGHPFAQADVWDLSNCTIVVVQGTTTIDEWIAYLSPGFLPVTSAGAGVSAYAGIAIEYDYFTGVTGGMDVFPTAPNKPVILCGHSVGGAVAQLLCARANAAAALAGTGITRPARAVYTFGAPAFLPSTKTRADYSFDAFDLTMRVDLDGDPVPLATQAALLAAKFPHAAPFFVKPMTDLQSLSITRHIQGKEFFPLLGSSEADRRRARQSVWDILATGVPSASASMLRLLIARHSISSYVDVTYQKARDSQTDRDPLTYLEAANSALDTYFQNLP